MQSEIITTSFLNQLDLPDIEKVQAVSGGDINLAFSLYSEGQRYFLKVQPNQPASFFDSEIAGLEALGAVVRVPEVVGHGEADGHAFLILKWIDTGTGDQADLGAMVAKLHHHHGQEFGFSVSNMHDKVPKDNTFQDSWPRFFIEQRLKPLLKLGLERSPWLKQYQDRFEALFETIENDQHSQNVTPSLLHGDLWAGNFMFNSNHQPVLIDPNAFYGDREYDLAITAVFGGFDDTFYEAYAKNYPLDAGWLERMGWYQLYYILMHYVRFGGPYQGRLEQMLLELPD
ncbi:fructosamine kinase family protein [Lactobacillaceae bacterium L1_55_11]|nr:fructosamine kinase family protein [Lactobacillaceae bacterium L1_55_11]